MSTFNSFEQLQQHVLSNRSLGVESGNPFTVLSNKKGLVKIPISPRRGNSQEVFTIRGLSDQNWKAVIWQCLFGTPRVYHWMILFDILNKVTKYEPGTQTIFNVMMLINSSSPKGGLKQQFNMKLKSVRAVLGLEVANDLAVEISDFTGINIPEKKPASSLKCSVETFKFSKPSEVRFIGVGYKDKGTLPEPGSEYEPTFYNETPLDPVLLWNKLLAGYKRKYS